LTINGNVRNTMAFIEPRGFTTTTGQKFTIRTAQPEDATALLAYIRPVAEETDFFTVEPDELPATDEDERKWRQQHLDHPGRIVLMAEVSEAIVGTLSFKNGAYRRIAHRGSLGISVAQGWRGQGIGTALLCTILNWATSNPLIEKVCLDVFDTNETAILLGLRNTSSIAAGETGPVTRNFSITS
jgi:RimJ/RimL family protein N-acetyltransferase